MTSAIPVRCSTNWAMKPHIGSKVNLLSSYLPVQWNHVKYIWNNSYLYLLPMCGFIAQLVEHRTGIAEVMGSNPVEALIFFRLLLSNCLNWKFTAMITLHFHLLPQFQMWIDHRKEIRELAFRVLALRRNESRNCGLCVVYMQKCGATLLFGAWQREKEQNKLVESKAFVDTMRIKSADLENKFLF